MLGSRVQNIYYPKVNLKKSAKNKDPKVFPKFKNGQKKCPKTGIKNTFAKIPPKFPSSYHNAFILRKKYKKFVTLKK